MNTIAISRRRFAQLLGVGAAGALVRPNLSFAQGAPVKADPRATNVVRLSSNENPYGPSLKALQAMSDSFGVACRYPDAHADALVEAVAKLNGVASEQVIIGDGSGEILKLCADAFTGPMTNEIKDSGRGKLVAADPTFESILEHAKVAGAEVVKVPLTPTYSHDLAKMGAAAKQGLIYICNPNNPTASITPKKELAEFIAKTPRDTMILVDEAYFHYADSPDYESVIPLVKDHPNLLVARTFSKIYGMAGLRCGYCVGQKEAIAKLHPHQQWDSVNCMAMAAALASLPDTEQVENGRRLNSEVKAFVSGQLDSLGYKLVPSQANFIMFDLKRPVVPVIQALKQRDVQVGRLFPAMPNHMRLTIGRKNEMDSFLTAFRAVMT
ncbi:MAG: aminotransferase class I/II-fold pyridoxal phosphate-dependent enzyme [Chthoniobacterales bacterium]